MPALIVALVAGLLFGAGLAVSQMVDPTKVLNFLDFGAIATGGWDPSLALVMAGALAVAAVGFRLARARSQPVCGGAFHMPARTRPDVRLIAGSIVFGAGWGLVGYCPGPAVASLAYGLADTVIFVAAMLLGMGLHHVAFEGGADVGATPSGRPA
jgi:uncharacterized membrane protein YedE/YeeE